MSDPDPSTRGPSGYVYQPATSDGTLAMYFGSGAGNFPTSPRYPPAIQQRAREDHAPRRCRSHRTRSGCRACGRECGLGRGRVHRRGHEDNDKNLTLWDNADDLINAITTVNADTIVVVHSVGPVILKTWIEGANVTAILRVWTGLPRQET